MICRPGGEDLTKKAALLAGIRKGDRVLDAGCGTGESLRFLTDTFFVDAVGIDISPSMIEQAKEAHPGLSFFVSDAGKLPFADAAFDAVFSECVLALMKDVAPAVREMSRVLKAGGFFVITTPVCKRKLSDDICKTLFTAEELFAVCAAQGLSVTYQSDEQKALTQYVADAVFRYGSVEEMMRRYATQTEASIFPCDIGRVPPKDIGYHLVVAKKDTAK